MSFRSKVTLAGFVALAAACTTEAGTPLGPDTGAGPTLNANMGGSRSQSADLFLISDPLTPGGSGTLTRLPNGITTHITVDPGAIPEGDVITVWGVIFNNPTKCAGTPCVPDDLGKPEVEPSIVWLGSGIASGGSTRYTGHVMVGDASGDIMQLLFGPDAPAGPGLLNAAVAEIHVILRTHGQPIPGQLQSQRKTFLGPNCTTDPEPNTDPCDDILFAEFLVTP